MKIRMDEEIKLRLKNMRCYFAAHVLNWIVKPRNRIGIFFCSQLSYSCTDIDWNPWNKAFLSTPRPSKQPTPTPGVLTRAVLFVKERGVVESIYCRPNSEHYILPNSSASYQVNTIDLWNEGTPQLRNSRYFRKGLPEIESLVNVIELKKCSKTQYCNFCLQEMEETK